MKVSKRSQQYKSKAKLIKLRNYKLKSFSHSEKDSQGNDIPIFIESKKVLTPIMPAIIQSNGEVWETGSLYFTKYLSINSGRDYKTLISIAYELLDFYRFIEDCQLEDECFDWLYFPLEEEDRITRRYVNHLDQLFKQNILKSSTRSKAINAIVGFYKFCFKQKLLDKGVIKNGLPFKIISKNISRLDSLGFGQIIEVKTTNVARSASKKKKTADGISDGHILHPIPSNDLEIIKEYLGIHPSRAFQLFFSFALETGARSQTISTIRIHHIKEILDTKPIFEDRLGLAIGNQTTIDSKFSSENFIYIPKYLCIELLKYCKSETWLENAKLSHYGVSDHNYVFLTKRGTPYYTSKAEIKELEDSDTGLNQNIAIGGTARSQLNTLLKTITEKHPDFPKFSIHDLRATFAMNMFHSYSNRGFNSSQALLNIKKMLGHKSVLTTEMYLDCYRELNIYNSAQQTLEQKLLKPLNNFRD